MTVEVRVRTAGRLHSAHRALLSSPPPGYRLVHDASLLDRILGPLYASTPLYTRLVDAMDRVVPVRLAKAAVDG